jgi:hypothetical protein
MTKKEFYLKACLVFAQDFASAYECEFDCQDNDVFREACDAAKTLTTYAELCWKDFSQSNGLVWDEDKKVVSLAP